MPANGQLDGDGPAAFEPAFHAVEEAFEVGLANGPHVRNLYKALFHEVAALSADQEAPALTAVHEVEGTFFVRRIETSDDGARIVAVYQRRHVHVAQPLAAIAAQGGVMVKSRLGLFWR